MKESEDFKRFMLEHSHKIEKIHGSLLTRTEHELLQKLVELKIGGFNSIVKLYRELTK